jgi:hypothetical protein
MNLYIETENGQIKNHPAFEDNLLQAFGEIPAHWVPFERIERPTLGTYEVMESETSTYELINGVWKDVWRKRDMTAEEKTAKQQAIITAFNTRDQAENWSAWTLDEATCMMVPPIPRPEFVEGKLVMWCGADNNWKEAPARPVDDNQYKFDFLAWQWVQVVDSAPV